jgi:hypothetical protein
MRISMSSMCTCCNTIIILLTIAIPSGPKPDDQPIEQLACMSNYMEAFTFTILFFFQKLLPVKRPVFRHPR